MTKKFFAALFAAMFAFTPAACSEDTSSATQVDWEAEIIKVGFEDPVAVYSAGNYELYLATAGGCRVRIITNNLEGRILVAIPSTDPSPPAAESIGDPNLELLKRDERFYHCFSSEEQ